MRRFLKLNRCRKQRPAGFQRAQNQKADRPLVFGMEEGGRGKGRGRGGHRGGGRPKRDSATPPFPRSLKAEERLAVVLAFEEASEAGASDKNALEESARQKYGNQLQHVHSEVSAFPTSIHKWGKTMYSYNLSESTTRLPQRAELFMTKTYQATRRTCNNVILSVFHKCYNKDGGPPSGTERAQLIEKIELELGKQSYADVAADPDAGSEPVGPAGADGEDCAEPGENDEAAPPTPAAGPDMEAGSPGLDAPQLKGDVQACFLTWLHLGPLGQRHANFMPPAPSGSKAGDTGTSKKPPGREEIRTRIKKEAAGSAGPSCEAQKVDELKKIRRIEERSYKIRAGALKLEKRKRAAEDFDQEVARLEKRIAIYSQSKAASAKAKVTAFEIELDALLERGPAEPSDDEEIEDDSDKGNESQQDEQEEGEEAGEDGEA